MKRGTGFFLLCALVSACMPLQVASTSTNLPPAQIQTNSPTPVQETALPSQSETDLVKEKEPTEYDLEVLFDYANHSLQVHEQIRFTNNSTEPINEVQLVVEAQRLRAGFTLANSEVGDGPEIGEPELSGGLLRIPLFSSLNPGETILLELAYDLMLPAGSGTLNWTDRQTNFIDWYPYIPPYISGQGWLVHEPALVGEHLVFDIANFKVHIEVSNAPASLQIAAPAPAKTNGTTFDYEVRGARRFVWSASGQYEVLDAEFGDVNISIYYFNEHRDAAEASLRTTKQALEIYSSLYGRYPYESLAIVEAQFFDGMESDGIFFLDQSYFLEYNYSPRNYLTTLTAHEVAHNWWFGQVGSDQALEPWLDEALCIYSELLYYENTYPEMVNWWWEFRVDRFRPQGSVDSTIYEHLGFDPYVQAVYMRGAQFLQAVRIAIGDGPFFSFLREYSTRATGQIVTSVDFFKVLKDYSSADLDPIISEFFNTSN